MTTRSQHKQQGFAPLSALHSPQRPKHQTSHRQRKYTSAAMKKTYNFHLYNGEEKALSKAAEVVFYCITGNIWNPNDPRLQGKARRAMLLANDRTQVEYPLRSLNDICYCCPVVLVHLPGLIYNTIKRWPMRLMEEMPHIDFSSDDRNFILSNFQ